jgi:hypothetical protein
LNKDGLTDDPSHCPIAKSAKKFRKILEHITARVQNIVQNNFLILGHRQSLANNRNPGNFWQKC